MSLQDCSQLAVTGVQGLIPYHPGKPVSELQRELGLTSIVKLASNENPLGPSPAVLSTIQNACLELGRYPDGAGFALKQALAKKLTISPEQLTLGNGSNDILEIIARAFLSPQSEAIMSEHAFAVYPLVTQAIGASRKIAAAIDYGHDLQTLYDRVNNNTRIVFIANPNNPTGTHLQHTAVEQFLDALPDHVIVVLDQAYFEYNQHTDESTLVNCLQKYPRLIITRTFSKAYGLAGLRVGYSISTPEVAELLNRVRQPFNVNSLALVAAEAALQDKAHLQASITLNQLGMQQLTAAFTAMKLDWIPSAGNFICVDCGQEAAPVYQLLLREGVIVRPVANYGLPQHLRITISTETDNQRLIQALEKVLK